MSLSPPHLRSLLEAWRIGRDKELLVDGDTRYWQLLVDDKPTTVPQTCAELVNPRHDGPILVAAVNALPALLAVYEAACAWRDAVRPGTTGAQYGSAKLALIAAIDLARKPKA